MFIKKNNVKSTINMGGGLGSGVLTLTVANGAIFPSTFPFLVTIWNKILYTDPSDDSGMEIVKVTGKSTNDLTIVRAQESTSDVSHANGSAVEMLITAGVLNENQDRAYNSVDADSGTLTNAAYALRVRLTFTPLYSGDYMVRWYNEFTNVNNKYVAMRIIQDATTTLAETDAYYTSGGINVNYKDRSGSCKVTLVGGTSYNFDMETHSDGSNYTVRRSRVAIERWL